MYRYYVPPGWGVREFAQRGGRHANPWYVKMLEKMMCVDKLHIRGHKVVKKGKKKAKKQQQQQQHQHGSSDRRPFAHAGHQQHYSANTAYRSQLGRALGRSNL